MSNFKGHHPVYTTDPVKNLVTIILYLRPHIFSFGQLKPPGV